ncbi:MAG: AmmeMemoRadiSam system protein A [Lachnospiraceae bacterium]|nr:AmmeMemoRadiSam system protein A [Lachnospiraceae bacterium]
MGIIAGFMVPHPPMIVPAIGRGSEETIKETTKSYEQVADMIAELKPDTIVISSPHSVMYRDYFHISPGSHASGSFAKFDAPEERYDVEYDMEFVDLLCELAEQNDIPAGTLGEKSAALDHGTMVPLYFIMKKYTDFKLVRIGLSGEPMQEHYGLGMAIKETSEKLGRRVCYIASGDLSHKLQEYGPYGFAKEGPVYDERIMDVMGRAAFDELLDFEEGFLDKAAECGHRSFVMMAGAFDCTDVEVTKLSHQDVTGVGYGICTYINKSVDEERNMLDKWNIRHRDKIINMRKNEDAYVKLARLTIENYIITHEKISWKNVKRRVLSTGSGMTEQLTAEQLQERDAKSDAHEELSNKRAGAFVSIHKNGALRGCIGTIGPTKLYLAEEIIENAISASTRDPRFLPITKDELFELEINVDVLGEIEPIESEDELDVVRYGVIVNKGNKQGLLLPNLDGVDTIEEQLSIAKRKAGLAPDEEGCKLYRFEVVRHT